MHLFLVNWLLIVNWLLMVIARLIILVVVIFVVLYRLFMEVIGLFVENMLDGRVTMLQVVVIFLIVMLHY